MELVGLFPGTPGKEIIAMTLIMCKLYSVVGQERQEALNVFGYKSNLVITDELAQFAASFKAAVVPQIAGVLHSLTEFTQSESFNLADPTAEYLDLYVPTIPGTAGGEALPAWVTWSFEYRRANRQHRSGRKGFSQVPESAQSDGIETPAFLTALNALSDVLEAPLKLALIDTWFPVILVRPTPPGTTWIDHPIQAVQYKGIGSQNTRKRR